MAHPHRRDMTADEFLLWCLDQQERYELVDGVPVPLRAMAGASNAHDRIVVNLIIALGTQLRGTRCRPTTADTALRTAIKRVRRPDVTIDCAPVDAKSYESRSPLAVFEVLSPSTRKTDLLVKLGEYQRHPTLEKIVLISPDQMDIAVYTRGADTGWQVAQLGSATETVTIESLALELSVAAIYEDVPLGEQPDQAAVPATN